MNSVIDYIRGPLSVYLFSQCVCVAFLSLCPRCVARKHVNELVAVVYLPICRIRFIYAGNCLTFRSVFPTGLKLTADRSPYTEFL